MSRWFPHPLVTLVLAVTWLLLANSASVGNILTGLLLGAVIPRFSSRFWPEHPRIRRPGLLLRYLGRLLLDIVRANLAMVPLVLGPVSRLQPAFVAVPLELRDEFAITVLASTISLTPGTVSADLSPDRRLLLVHAINAPDPDALVQAIKARYERPLKEIFE